MRQVSRLRVPNRDMLVAYARFIGDSPDYVVNQLIETMLAKDREFLAWRGEGSAADVAGTDDGDAANSAGGRPPAPRGARP